MSTSVGRSGIDHIGVAVSFIVWDGNTSILVHRRGPACRDERGSWDTGSGEVEYGEEPAAAVLREISQEHGIKDKDLYQPPTLLRARSVVREATTEEPRSHWITFLHLVRVREQRDVVVPEAERAHVEHPLWINPLNVSAVLPLHSQTATHIGIWMETMTPQQHSWMRQAAHQEKSEWFTRYLARLPTPDQRALVESLIVR